MNQLSRPPMSCPLKPVTPGSCQSQRSLPRGIIKNPVLIRYCERTTLVPTESEVSIKRKRFDSFGNKIEENGSHKIHIVDEYQHENIQEVDEFKVHPQKYLNDTQTKLILPITPHKLSGLYKNFQDNKNTTEHVESQRQKKKKICHCFPI